MANVKDVKAVVSKVGIKTVFDFMTQKKDLIASALPKHITAERLVGMFTIVIRSNPELMSCSQTSLIGAIVQTAQLGLMPGNINHCYYVPFNNRKKDGQTVREVQFILGYRGMIELVNRSGSAVILSAECVYENDEFHYEQGLNPKLVHRPVANDRGSFSGVYCIAKNLLANEKLFIYLDKNVIEKVRGASKAGQSEYSPWNKWPEEMAKKTAIKRICKLLPLSVDVQVGIQSDETIKNRISPDMPNEPDETNWEDAHIVESPKKVEQPKEVINGKKPEPKDWEELNTQLGEKTNE